MIDARQALRTPDGPDLVQHLLGEQLGEIRHMCPDCGPPNLFCPWCYGDRRGITTEQLARWQAAQWVGKQV